MQKFNSGKILVLMTAFLLQIGLSSSLTDFNAYWNMTIDGNETRDLYDAEINGPTHITDPLVGGAYSFDGVTDFLNLSYAQVIPNESNSFGISVMARFNNTLNQADYGLFLQFNHSSNNFISYYTSVLGNKNYTWRIGFRGASIACEKDINQTYNESMYQKWTHLVFNYNGGAKGDCNSYELWINGTNVTGGSIVTVGGGAQHNRLGADNVASNGEILGEVSRLIQYNRTLSQVEVNQLLGNDGDPFFDDNLTTDVLAYWQLEEDGPFYDASYTSTTFYNLTTDTVKPIRRHGRVEAGQQFNGTTASCSTCSKITTVGNHTLDQDDDVSQGFAFSWWAKIFPNQDRSQYMISHRDTSGDVQGNIEIFLTNDTNIRVDGRRDNTYEVDIEMTGIVNITDGEWHHFVYQFQQPNFPTQARNEFFVDGQNVSSTANGFPNFAEINTTTTFGGRGFNNATGLGGYMDEIILYNRSLNGTEITTLYNSGRGYDPFLGQTYFVNKTFNNGNTGVVLDDFNISYEIWNNESMNFSDYTLDGNFEIYVRNSTAIYNVTAEVLNTSNYSMTTNYNQTVATTEFLNTSFYNESRIEINFFDTITLADVDNVSLEIIGVDSYVNNTLNHTIFTVVTKGVYNLRASSNISWYPDQSIKNNQDFTNNTTISGTIPYFNVSMFFLNSSGTGSSNVTATVFDQSLARLEGASIHVQLFDAGNNSFTTTQIVTTNFEGETRFQANLFSSLYRFLIFYEDELRFTSTSEEIISTTLNFFIDTVSPAGTVYFSLSELNFACGGEDCLTYNNNTRTLTLDWINLESPATEVCLNVTRKSILNPPLVTNTSCSNATSGQINIVVVNGTGFIYQADAFVAINASPRSDYLLGSYDISFPASNPNAQLGIFLTVIFVFVGLGLGAFNPAVALWTVPLSILITRAANLNNIPFEVIVPMLVAGIMISIWISRRA